MSNEQATAELRQWLMGTAEQGASDLHLVAAYPPMRRLHGDLTPVEPSELDAAAVRRALRCVCSDDDWAKFERERNLDFAIELDAQRFRVNYFFSGENPGACFRVIPSLIPEFDWANFPISLAEKIASLRNGLIVFSGVTGSGKTTSMAMMTRMLIRSGGMRVVTIEDPIEYRFPQTASSVITQREVGRDVGSFAEGLKYAMRQDPDIIVVGEIRDQETARMALSAAETGHLVLTTLHTRDAKGTITRFIDLFPAHSHSETCSMLSIGLRAVISQHLLPNIVPGEKRELALELMFNTNPVAAAIRQGRVDSLDNAILGGRKDGMVTLDDSVKRLLQERRIAKSTAERFISDKDLLRR